MTDHSRSEQLNACKEKALTLLNQRPYACEELAGKLERRGFGRNVVETAVQEFTRTGLLDDQQYAKDYTRQSVRQSKPYGPLKIDRELRKRGVPAEYVREALEEVFGGEGEEEGRYNAACKAAEAKYRSIRRQNRDVQKQRAQLYRFLARRGFESNVCNEVVDAFFEGDADEW